MDRHALFLYKIKHPRTCNQIIQPSEWSIRYVKFSTIHLLLYNTFSISCTFNRSNAFKMKNDNRVCRSGGIRRIFDKPPPRLLKIHFVQFLQLRRYNCFPILRSLSSFCVRSRTRSDLVFNFSIILNHMLSVKLSL